MFYSLFFDVVIQIKFLTDHITGRVGVDNGCVTIIGVIIQLLHARIAAAIVFHALYRDGNLSCSKRSIWVMASPTTSQIILSGSA